MYVSYSSHSPLRRVDLALEPKASSVLLGCTMSLQLSVCLCFVIIARKISSAQKKNKPFKTQYSHTSVPIKFAIVDSMIPDMYTLVSPARNIHNVNVKNTNNKYVPTEPTA